jgi:hypothetical protein
MKVTESSATADSVPASVNLEDAHASQLDAALPRQHHEVVPRLGCRLAVRGPRERERPKVDPFAACGEVL